MNPDLRIQDPASVAPAPHLPALQEVADHFIHHVLGVNGSSWPYTQLVYAVLMLAASLLVFAFALHFAGLFIFFERRIAARMQSRVGPNRVGPNGFIQWAADGIKCLFKEDLVPQDADPRLFRLAPYFVVVGMLMAFAAMPFSSALIATDIGIGILFILGVTSLVVIGLLMAGWGSNSRWALLGGMRSVAQVVSYEIPAGIAAMTVVVMAGSLSMQDLIRAQGGAPWDWAVAASPFTLGAFVSFFVAQLAEGNRTPFDLPEAESELVSGYNTEYSGMRFLMFFLAEFANVWVLAAVVVALFLGGWQIPFGEQALDGTYPTWIVRDSTTGVLFAILTLSGAIPFLWLARALAKARSAARAAIDRAAIPPQNDRSGHPLFRSALKLSLDGGIAFSLIAGLGLVLLTVAQFTRPFDTQVETLTGFAWATIRQPIALNGLQLGIFVAKTLVVVFVIIQIRWTLPRVRVDQMMTLCWKYLVPLSLVCMIGTVAWELIVYSFSPLGLIMRVLMTALAAFVVYRYVQKTRRNYLADKAHFEVWRDETPWYPPWKLV